MQVSKTKTAFYKLANMGPDATATLSQALWAALVARPTIGDRRQQLGQGDSANEWLVIGHFTGNANRVSCALMRYSPGTAAATLLDDLNARQAQLRAVVAPAEGALQREFIDGMLILVAAGNHVALLQSHTVRERTLENHLYWLLHSTGLLVEGQSVTLDDRPTQAAIDAAEASPVRFVELRGDFNTVRRSTPQAKVSRRIWNAFNTMVDGGAMLPLDQLDTSKIGVSVKLQYEGRRQEVPGAALDRLARVLRHEDGVNVTVHLDNGSTFENEQLRTSGKIQVLTEDGLPILTDAYNSLGAWLRQRLES